MKYKTVVLAILFLYFSAANTFGSWDKKPRFSWTQLYHYDLRQDKHQFYSNCLSLTLTYLNRQGSSAFVLTPFLELRRNIHQGLFEKKRLGIEAGKQILPCFYLGNAIQQVWLKEDYRDYGKYESKKYLESVTRVLFSRKLVSGRYLTLKGFVLDEYAYDFDSGAGLRNDVVIGVTIPFHRHIEAGLSWRHIDRIKFYDSDTFEASVTLVF